ncbi:MAG: hypothetical protein A2161_04210 [Candidatus Schekmanbacteria bacterium RBG_13_48_7]|uniref:PIN domain-containing protein n=1 Tax=Candidatus Schekmanbacteria bacterium RBG_13_48_7 TaxID=1817878 RepID=A0A1F7RNP8_9BACT|nr:MAG: hypothetical protein A2161_04210 [Candidatus Schekmanbacteria bacterium RBG_13_48_7]
MIAAVDSSIILDILLNDQEYVEQSMNLLVKYHLKGSIIISPIVFSECAASLKNPDIFGDIMDEMGLQYQPLTPDICKLAAKFWHQYRIKGGARKRILADFLNGAHAQIIAGILLTRDRGFYKNYFTELQIIAPKK